jgi:hypothetical protein
MMKGSTEANLVAGATAATPGIRTPHWLQALRMSVSFPALMAVMLIAVALVGAQSHLIDPDTWWHITVGEQILKTHIWPTADTFSFTARGAHWIAYEWLGEVFLAITARAGGLVGLAWLQKAMVVALTLLLYLYSYLVSGNSKAACIASAAVLPIAPVAFALRPQIFGYIFFLLTLICMQQFRRGYEKALWFIPVLFLVWVNTHGTFVFGLLVIGIRWITGFFNFRLGELTGAQMSHRQSIKLLLTFLFCVLALWITPYGSQIAANPIEMAISQPINIEGIQEWQPLSLTNSVGVYILIFVMGLFLAQVILRFSYTIEEMTLLLFAMYAAFAHLRFAMIFVLLTAPIVAANLARWVPPYDPSKEKYALNLTLISLVIAAFCIFRPSERSLQRLVAIDYPVYAVEYLREHPQPVPMFNEYGWGGYLISQLGPAQPVFIDGRADLYEYSGILPDYFVAASGQVAAIRVLARHDIRSCLLNRSSALAGLLDQSTDWKKVYSDDLSVIFIRLERTRS